MIHKLNKIQNCLNIALVSLFFITLYALKNVIESRMIQFILAFFILLVAVLGSVLVEKSNKAIRNTELHFGENKNIGILIFAMSVFIFAYVDYNSRNMLGRIQDCVSIKIYIWAFVVISVVLLARNVFKDNIILLGNVFCVFMIALSLVLFYKPYTFGDLYNYEAYWLNTISLYGYHLL